MTKQTVGIILVLRIDMIASIYINQSDLRSSVNLLMSKVRFTEIPYQVMCQGHAAKLHIGCGLQMHNHHVDGHLQGGQ